MLFSLGAPWFLRMIVLEAMQTTKSEGYTLASKLSFPSTAGALKVAANRLMAKKIKKPRQDQRVLEFEKNAICCDCTTGFAEDICDVATEGCGNMKSPNLLDEGLDSDLSESQGLAQEVTKAVYVLGLQRAQMRHVPKSLVTKTYKGDEGPALPVQKRKYPLKHFIRATLIKKCHSERTQRSFKISVEAAALKRESIQHRRFLREHDAQTVLAEAMVMQGMHDENKKLFLPGMVEGISQNVVKYWCRRYSLFSRFDEGVKMDEEGLFSVTPEDIAKHQAAHCGSGTVIDAFAGVGGNAIQFALMNFHVIAIDINPKKIEYAKHNAVIYGVADRIDFIVGDFFQLAPMLKADVIFLSPPWGGPEYIKADKYDIQKMMKPKDGFLLFKVALSIAPSIVFFLPRNVDHHQLIQLSWLSNPPLACEIEKNFVHDELKTITAYYGNITG